VIRRILGQKPRASVKTPSPGRAALREVAPLPRRGRLRVAPARGNWSALPGGCRLPRPAPLTSVRPKSAGDTHGPDLARLSQW